MHRIGPRKPHFVFGGMHIDIHLIIGNLHENHSNRKLPLDQALGVSLKEGMLNNTVPHKPAVDENIDSPGGAAGDSGRGYPACDGQILTDKFNRAQFRSQVAAQNICHPIHRGFGRRPGLYRSPIV
jgi:hypothetical protein